MIEPVIKITNLISGRLSAGINFFWGIKVKNSEVLSTYIKGELPGIIKNHSVEMPPGFSVSRKLYQAFSVDPTKYRPSSEALWRRMKKGLDFPIVNPFVDLTNFLSLKYQVPYGLYDLDKIAGDIEIRQGCEGDSYQGIRKDIITLDGKILVSDTLGPFGNPSSDSLRTSTTSGTLNLLQIIFFHKSDILKEKILSGTYNLFFEYFIIGDSKSYMLD
ncbi:MAG: phenylalanine--tRNA ligase beta subunit-related protein [Acidobacteria bacterium]|jgi:DNA/RNA-binding domain of Phe-tRNA-synthetase-like protein|nr:phenylalanine--tRNA ligase beta subunit-related protein [Acidobacteriota bacterium]